MQKLLGAWEEQNTKKCKTVEDGEKKRALCTDNQLSLRWKQIISAALYLKVIFEVERILNPKVKFLSKTLELHKSIETWVWKSMFWTESPPEKVSNQ